MLLGILRSARNQFFKWKDDWISDWGVGGGGLLFRVDFSKYFYPRSASEPFFSVENTTQVKQFMDFLEKNEKRFLFETFPDLGLCFNEAEAIVERCLQTENNIGTPLEQWALGADCADSAGYPSFHQCFWKLVENSHYGQKFALYLLSYLDTSPAKFSAEDFISHLKEVVPNLSSDCLDNITPSLEGCFNAINNTLPIEEIEAAAAQCVQSAGDAYGTCVNAESAASVLGQYAAPLAIFATLLGVGYLYGDKITEQMGFSKKQKRQ